MAKFSLQVYEVAYKGYSLVLPLACRQLQLKSTGPAYSSMNS